MRESSETHRALEMRTGEHGAAIVLRTKTIDVAILIGREHQAQPVLKHPWNKPGGCLNGLRCCRRLFGLGMSNAHSRFSCESDLKNSLRHPVLEPMSAIAASMHASE